MQSLALAGRQAQPTVQPDKSPCSVSQLAQVSTLSYLSQTSPNSTAAPAVPACQCCPSDSQQRTVATTVAADCCCCSVLVLCSVFAFQKIQQKALKNTVSQQPSLQCLLQLLPLLSKWVTALSSSILSYKPASARWLLSTAATQCGNAKESTP